MADIHANLEALQAVLDDSKKNNCDRHAFLGDYVGYCADPKACLDIVRSLKAPCVKGNYDDYCSTDSPIEGFNPNAAKAVLWTHNQLSAEDRNWLQNLPYTLEVEGFAISHASLDNPQQWKYVFDKLAAASSFRNQRTQVCFFGHTHVPVSFVQDSIVRGGSYTKFKVEQGKQYFVNIGSVGQPRDHNSKAAYVIYDLAANTIELRRVIYDIVTTQKKIREAGLDQGQK